MQHYINGLIKISPTAGITFDSEINFVSASGATIKLKSESAYEISALITFESDDNNGIKEFAEVELSQTCDVISLFQNLSIIENKITGFKSEGVDTKGNKVIITNEILTFGDAVSTVMGLGKIAVKNLTDLLEQIKSPELEEVMFKWREAISSESSTMRYLLFYRLLESLLGNNLDKWIIKSEPDVQIIADRVRGNTTIYSNLRDNIHPKQKIFPVNEIHDELPKLQELVRKAIREKFEI